MKKLLAFFLATVSLFTLVACSGDESTVPDGYKLASDTEICAYSLYVPETWIAASDRSDYTIASVGSTDKCTVSIAKLEDVYEASMQDYWNTCKDKYTFLSEFTVIEEGAEALVGGDGRRGYRYVFSGKYGDTEYKYMQIFFFDSAALSPSMYCFTYTATAEHYDGHLETVNAVLSHFKFN